MGRSRDSCNHFWTRTLKVESCQPTKWSPLKKIKKRSGLQKKNDGNEDFLIFHENCSFFGLLFTSYLFMLSSIFLSFLLACLLSCFPPSCRYFFSLLLLLFLAWFFALLPASLLTFSCLSSLRQTGLFFFMCFSLACGLSSVFLLLLFSLPLSFLLSLLLLPYSSKTILLPCILGFFFLPSLLSCFLSFFSHFCFLVFLLFLFSSSVALPYPTTKSRGLWSKGALPALLCVLFRCHLVSMFSQDLSFVPDSFVSCLGCVLVH